LWATPCHRLITDGENRDSLTRRRWFLIGREKSKGNDMAAKYIDPNDSARAFTPEQISALMAGVSLRAHGQRGVEPIISRIREDIKTGLVKAANGQIDREEVVRYLKDQNLRTDYQFDLTQPSSMTGWPWGSHHTVLLGYLDAAARKFWSEYDPANAKTTAPKNQTVISWLVDEKNLSTTVATSMATILRADGLKTGPKK